MREVTNSNNIGSIITMLIDEQHVNIDDILTEEQFRQDCQQQTQVLYLYFNVFQLFLSYQTKIKEEVETALSDFGANSYQDFSFGVQQGYREGVNNVWSGSMSNMGSDQQSHSEVQGGLEKEGQIEENFVLKCFCCSEPAYSAFSYTERGREGRQILGEAEVTSSLQ